MDTFINGFLTGVVVAITMVSVAVSLVSNPDFHIDGRTIKPPVEPVQSLPPATCAIRPGALPPIPGTATRPATEEEAMRPDPSGLPYCGKP